MGLQEFKEELLKDPEFCKEYERFDPVFELGQICVEIRIRKAMLWQKIIGWRVA